MTTPAPGGPPFEVLPRDVHNLKLLHHVHPASWRNPEPAPRYNLVVVGAGTAGLVTAAGGAGLGARVALVERHLLGGDCLNVGCVPSKCVIRASRAAAEVRDAEQFGVRVPAGVAVDFGAAMERMRRLRAGISPHDSAERLSGLGIDVFFGGGRFTGPDTVEVDGRRLRFKRAVIATGARAVDPDIPGLGEAGFLTNETVFNLTERPGALAVIGAGPIGCELSQAFRRLGSEVVVLDSADHILVREDPDAAEILQAAFRREGIALVLGAAVTRVTRRGSRKVVQYTAGGRSAELVVDDILVGAGRAPNVEGLGLEAAGVAYDTRRGVVVNDYLQTSNPRIYAAGDVSMQHKFTHMADAAARIVLQNALFLGRRKLSGVIVPWCTYTDPEIAHVGLYARDAAASGLTIDTITIPFREVDRAIADGEEDGFVRVHLRKGSDRIVGATIVARHAGEMVSELTLAMVAGVGLKTIATVVHPYPTQAEAIRKAADAYNRGRLTPGVKRAFKTWLGWIR